MVNEFEMYDAIYSDYKTNGTTCRVSCHVLEKARRNVRGVMRTFGLGTLSHAKVLDIGCGLGYFSEALREQGAEVTAIDTSHVAIEFVRETFPEVHARVGSFPEDFSANEQFDIIWAIDFSLLNTFDVNFICRNFIQPSLQLLSPKGSLIIGWHSNFSGTMGGDSHWAHWTLRMIEEMKHKGRLQGPRVVTIPSSMLSSCVIQASRFLRKSIPIYLCRTVK